MRNGERPPKNPERRGNDKADLGLQQRLGALTDQESALLAGRRKGLDPYNPETLRIVQETLDEIEEARRTKGENDE
jgi:hypothetical protein